MDDSALEDISSRISGMSEAESNVFLAQAGFSDDLRRVMSLGNEEYQKRMEYASRYHAISQQEIDDLNKARDAWSEFGSTASTISERVQAAISPAITGALSELSGFLNENADAIASGVGRITDNVVDLASRGASAAKDIAGYLSPIWDILDYAVEEYVGWDNAIGGIVLTLGGLSAITIPATIASSLLGITSSITGMTSAGTSFADVFGKGGLFVAAIAATVLAIDQIIEAENKHADEMIRKAIERTPEEAFIKTSTEDMIKEENKKSWHGGFLGNVISYEEANNRVREKYGYGPRTVDENGIDHGYYGPNLWTQMAINSRIGNSGSNGANVSQNVNVTNEININGVRNAEQVAPSVGQAVGDSVQNALQNNYKVFVPDGIMSNG